MKLLIALLLSSCLSAVTLYQINAGGDLGSASGVTWQADGYYAGGARWVTGLSALPVPYSSLRYTTSPGTSLTYTFAVTPGKYICILKFVEPNKTGPGQRVFSIALNGTVITPAMDLYAVAGLLKPYDLTYPTTITGNQLVLTLTGITGNAVLSGIQIDNVPAPAANTITCESGTLTVGTELTADAPSQEVEVMSNIPGTRRWEQIQLCATTRFLGQGRVTASMGRPGPSNNYEMTGTEAQMENSSENTNCWTAHPGVPQFEGPYSEVINVKAYTTGNGGEVPGKINALTTGMLTWEACGYEGKIGALNLAGKTLERFKVLQCSGSGSGIDPLTGKQVGWDCAGLLWAKYLLQDGLTLSFIGVRDPFNFTPSAKVSWTPVR
jgi:hypothetical protein